MEAVVVEDGNERILRKKKAIGHRDWITYTVLRGRSDSFIGLYDAK